MRSQPAGRATLRVIAGSHRGRTLLSPVGDVRPIPVILRKSLFDILGARLRGRSLLDGFAGSGVVGIEALSRGAARVDFVESDRRALDTLRRNLQRIGSPPEARVHAMRCETFLAGADRSWDFIFLDPPYEKGPPGGLVEATFRRQRVSPDGLVIVKAPAGCEWPGSALTLVRVKRQGSNALYFFARGCEPDATPVSSPNDVTRTGEGSRDGEVIRP